MDGRRHMREVYDAQHLREFPSQNIILKYYMISAWWLHLLGVLMHYVIHPGAIEQVMVMTNNIITLGYNYSKGRINNPPNIFYKLTHTVQLIVWIPSRLAWTPALRGRY